MGKKLSYKKELARVMKMASRLEREDYEAVKDISSLSAKQLSNIRSRKDLVRRGFYEFNNYEKLRNEQVIRQMERLTVKAQKMGYDVDTLQIVGISKHARRNISSIRDLKKYGIISEDKRDRSKPSAERIRRNRDKVSNLREVLKDTYVNHGENIPRERVFRGSQATVDMNMLQNMAEYGKNYRTLKADKSGEEAVNESGRRLANIIIEARKQHTDEELIEAINRNYGGVKKFAKLIERLVLAVYDDEYSKWAGGGDVYDVDVREIEYVLTHLEGADLATIMRS